MANAQKPDFVFRRNGRVHLNLQGRQFSRLLAVEVYASAVVMLDTPCSEVVWRVLATHSIRQFPLHIPSRASPCAITFQLDSTTSNFIFWSPKQDKNRACAHQGYECSRKQKHYITLRYITLHYRQGGKVSSVGTATRYGLDGSGFESRRRHYFPGQYRRGPEAQPASSTMTNEVSFPEIQQPGRGDGHPPPSSADIKDPVELYLYSPSQPAWTDAGQTYLWPFTLHTDTPSTSARWQQASLVFGTCSKQSLGLMFLSPTNALLYYMYKMLKYTVKISHDCSYMFRSIWTIIREPMPNLAKVTVLCR